MIRRYVARQRRRVIRAAGLPNVPNLPSARALAQRELRTGLPRASRRRGRQHVTTADDLAESPLLDPSRELGEGPDELTRGQAAFVWLGVVVFVWLSFASCDPNSPQPPANCSPTGERYRSHSHC